MQDHAPHVWPRSYCRSGNRSGFSQNELVKRMGIQDQINYVYVSKYELDKNEPPAFVLLAYARLMRIPVETLIDDRQDLPSQIRPHRI